MENDQPQPLISPSLKARAIKAAEAVRARRQEAETRRMARETQIGRTLAAAGIGHVSIRWVLPDALSVTFTGEEADKLIELLAAAYPPVSDPEPEMCTRGLHELPEPDEDGWRPYDGCEDCDDIASEHGLSDRELDQAADLVLTSGMSSDAAVNAVILARG